MANFARAICVALFCLLGLRCADGFPASAPIAVSELIWRDGDSGFAHGVVFRLADVDAPETGPVGDPRGARCASERVLGLAAEEAMGQLTDEAARIVLTRHGVDRYGRWIVDLEVDGASAIAIGLAEGHLAPWPHVGGRALSPKPDWCLRAKRDHRDRT